MSGPLQVVPDIDDQVNHPEQEVRSWRKITFKLKGYICSKNYILKVGRNNIVATDHREFG